MHITPPYNKGCYNQTDTLLGLTTANATMLAVMPEKYLNKKKRRRKTSQSVILYTLCKLYYCIYCLVVQWVTLQPNDSSVPGVRSGAQLWFEDFVFYSVFLQGCFGFSPVSFGLVHIKLPSDVKVFCNGQVCHWDRCVFLGQASDPLRPITKKNSFLNTNFRCICLNPHIYTN